MKCPNCAGRGETTSLVHYRHGPAVWSALLLALAVWLLPAPVAAGPAMVERVLAVTWYVSAPDALMYDGTTVRMGVAACSWDLEEGSVIVFADGRVVVCRDRGMLGSAGHVDVWAPDRQAGQRVADAYGSVTTVRVFAP